MKWWWRLLAVFILLPVVELALLLEIGRRVGTLTTIMLIIVTGALGASLVKRQGIDILNRIWMQLEQGEMPAGELVDGLMVAVAGVLLLTPGVITDATGFLLLIKAVRDKIKAWAVRWFTTRTATGAAFAVRWRR